MTSRLYLEGGGESKELQRRCREGFRKLFENAGFAGRMPRIIACGGRQSTFDDFCTSHESNAPGFIGMLIDSESPVAGVEQSWRHLKSRDNWAKPQGASDDQALLMTTCMETWIACDRDALRERFGPRLRDTALPPLIGLENRVPAEILAATQASDRGMPGDVRKGKNLV